MIEAIIKKEKGIYKIIIKKDNEVIDIIIVEKIRKGGKHANKRHI